MKYRMLEEGGKWTLTHIDDFGQDNILGPFDDFDSVLTACRATQGLLPHIVEEPEDDVSGDDASPEPKEATSEPETAPERPSSDDEPDEAT